MFRIRLKALRESLNMSQKELATALSVTQGTVGNWESGSREPSFDTLVKLSDYFNCSTDYLLGRTDDPDIEIRKAPSKDGAEGATYKVHKDAPEFSEEEIRALEKFLESQRKQ